MNNIENTGLGRGKEKQLQGKFFYRKLQSVGKGVSLSVTLPKRYALELNLDRLSFVRMSRENGKIVLEKVE